MIESLLFKDCQFITNGTVLRGDIYCEQGKIKEIAPSLTRDAELVIHEPNLLLLPGMIDPHVHFREPGAEYKENLESGSRAAAAGGVTSFFEMPNTKPSTTSIETMAAKKAIAAVTSLVNYNFFIGATHDNLKDLNEVENVAGIKIYVGSSTGNLLVDGQEELDAIFKNGNRLIAVHSETEAIVQANKDKYADSTDVLDHLNIRSVEAAITCTQMLIDLAIKHQRRFHVCHLTTQEEAECFEGLGSKYPFITTEVSPQHLFLQAPEIYNKIGTYAQINPPIREQRHRLALEKALKNGTIPIIATDHAPHTIEEKEQPFPKAPSGMPGIETSLPLLLTWANQGACKLSDVVRWMSTDVARLFNIQNKGQIKEGFDADLVLVDLNAKYTIKNEDQVTKAGWSAFDGFQAQGRPVATFVNGQMVFREGDFFDRVKGKEVLVNSF